MKIKTTKCPTCETGTAPLFGAYKVRIKARDGARTIRVCNDCAATLEGIRMLRTGHELREDKIIEDDKPV